MAVMIWGALSTIEKHQSVPDLGAHGVGLRSSPGLATLIAESPWAEL